MAIKFELDAEMRADQGKGASRRLRFTNNIPAIIYGADKAPAMISLNHDKVILALEHEAFYSHVLSINLGGAVESVILKDVQRHPYKPKVQHMDFQRVSATEKLHTKVPVHFVNQANSVGVKAGGLVHHEMNELEVLCLAADLPEFIEVDMTNVAVGHIVHVADLKLPAGVTAVALQHGDNKAVVSIHAKKGAAAEETVEATKA